MAKQEWDWADWGKASPVQRLRLLWDRHPVPIAAGGFGLLVVGTCWFWSDIATFLRWLLNRSEDIRNLMLSLGVVGAGIGVWVAFRRSETDRQRAETDRLRQVTETFEGAVTLLSHEDRSVRLGAIYALERIARQNKDEHWPIMEILTAYVREWSDRLRLLGPEELGFRSLPHLQIKQQMSYAALRLQAPEDLRAVFTVLGRRRRCYDSPNKRLNLADAYLVKANPDPRPERNFSRLNLEGADLSGANLLEGDLRAAWLDGADLRGADLPDANLEGAELTGANLEEAFLVRANLTDTRLKDANLRGKNLASALFRRAYLSGAHLERTFLWGAVFEGASLGGTHLQGADLTKASGLTQDQLNSAIGDAFTKIPEGLTRPEHWSKE